MGESVLVAVGEGEAVGFLVSSRAADEAEVLNVAVHPSWRRRGIARQLLHRLLIELRAVGVERCHLEVRVSNNPAQSLYRSLGFVEQAIRKDYYRSINGREDALLMQLPLEASR